MPDQICPECQKNTPSADGAYCRSCGQILHGGGLLRGKYRLLKMIGQGGLGQVYRAEDTQVYDRICAVKRIGPPQSVIDAELTEREARLLAQLQSAGVPGVPDIYDAFTQDDSFFVVMRHIEGENLKRWRQSAKPTWQAVVERFIQVLYALDNIHRLPAPIVHADIKPENIIQDEFGVVWLLDFGLGRVIQAGSTVDAYVPGGTINYSPWEQWSQPPTPASDVYSVGLALYYLLVGDELFQQRRSVNTHFVYPHPGLTECDYFDPKWARSLRNALLLSTCENPDQRISASGFLDLLKASLPSAARPPLTIADGSQLHTSADFLDLAERDRPAALSIFSEGIFAAWLNAQLYRDGLASALETIRRNYTDPEEALEAALHLMNPALSYAQLKVVPSQIRLKRIGIFPRRILFRVSNPERGYLHLELSSSVPWLEVRPETIGLQAQETQPVYLTVYPDQIPPNTTNLTAEVSLDHPEQGTRLSLSGHMLWLDHLWLQAFRPFFQKIRPISSAWTSFVVALIATLIGYAQFTRLPHFNALFEQIPMVILLLPLIAKIGALVGAWIGKGAFVFQNWKKLLRSLVDLYLLSFLLMLILVVSAVLLDTLLPEYHLLRGVFLPVLFLIPFLAIDSRTGGIENSNDPYEPIQWIITGPLSSLLISLLFGLVLIEWFIMLNK